MTNQWDVQLKGRTLGPFNDQQLQQLADSGRVTATTPVRLSGSSAWSTAASVPGLLKLGAAAKAGSPKATSAEWYVGRDGQQEGPFSFDRLKLGIATGDLRPDDLVWKKGMPDWLPAQQVPELSRAFGVANRPDGSPGSEPSGGIQKSPTRLIPWVSTAALLVIVVWLVLQKPAAERDNPVAEDVQAVPELERKAREAADVPPEAKPEPLLADAKPGPQLPDGPAQVPGNEPPRDELPVPQVQRPDVDPADLNAILRGRPAGNLPPAVVGNQAGGWQIFRHPKGPISAEMPTPVVLNRSGSLLPPAPGTVQIQLKSPPGVNVDPPATYTAATEQFSCSLRVASLPAFVARQLAANSSQFEQLARQFLQDDRDALDEEFGGKVVRDIPLRWFGVRGRDLRLENDSHVAVIKLVFTSSHVIQAGMVFPRGEEPKAELERFFGSLTLSLPGKPPLRLIPDQTPQVADAKLAAKKMPKGNTTTSPPGQIPPKVREFLERSEAWRQSLIREKKSQIDALELSIANLPLQSRAAKRKELALAKTALTAISENERPAAELSYPVEAGDIGYAGVFSNVFFLDGSTLEATVRFGIHDRYIVVTNVDVAALESQVKRINATETGKIWAHNGLLRVLPQEVAMSLQEKHSRLRRSSQKPVEIIVCEPIDKNEVEKYRGSFQVRPQPAKAD